LINGSRSCLIWAVPVFCAVGGAGATAPQEAANNTQPSIVTTDGMERRAGIRYDE